MDAIVAQLVASAIIAIFGGVSGQFIKRMKAQRGADARAQFQARPPQPAPYAGAPRPGWQPPAAPAPVWQAPAPTVNAGQVILHIGILQFAVNVVGFIIGFTVAAIGRSSGASEESITST